jgi:hypothetical protein
MSDLSPETRRLIDMARDGDRLPPGRRARLETRFFARVAGGAVIGLAAREAFAKSGLFGPVAKGLAGLAVVSSIGAGGYLAVRATRSDLAASMRPTSTESSHATHATNDMRARNETIAPATPIVAAPSRPQRAAETEPSRRSTNGVNVAEPRESVSRRSGTPVAAKAPAPSRGSTPRASAPAAAVAAAPAQTTAPAATTPPAPEAPAPAAEEAPPARPSTALADETRLLWEADQALRSGSTSRALSLLDEHASRYPDGSLSPERGAERVVALCKLGRIDAPTVRGYLASHPNVSLSERIQQACSRILGRSK